MISIPSTPVIDDFSVPEDPISRSGLWIGSPQPVGNPGSMKADGTGLVVSSGSGYGGATYAKSISDPLEFYYTRDAASDNYIFFDLDPASIAGDLTNSYGFHDQFLHGSVTIGRYSGGSGVTLLDVAGGTNSSDAYVIRRFKNGDMVIYLNGKFLGLVNDTTWSAGYIGFITNAVTGGGGIKKFGGNGLTEGVKDADLSKFPKVLLRR